MQSRNSVAHLLALTLLFSYAESLLPRLAPFKIGLANAVTLFALSLDVPSFFALCLAKPIVSSLMAGTLFSPFFAVSLAQSVCSGALMFALNAILPKRFFSCYGISLLGAAASTFVQIFLCRAYLGSGVMGFLPPLLLFSLFSGTAAAFVHEQFAPDFEAGLSAAAEEEKPAKADGAIPKRAALKTALLVFLSATVFMVNTIAFRAPAFVLSLALQKRAGRRIRAVPHVFLWLFVFATHLFSPCGRVLFRLWTVPATDGALRFALSQSLALSAAMALSQCVPHHALSKRTIVAQAFAQFGNMMRVMDSGELAGKPLAEKISRVIRAQRQAE